MIDKFVLAILKGKKSLMVFQSLFFVLYICQVYAKTTPDSILPSGTQKAPNFIFVLVDDQRHDMAGSLGTAFLNTPNIDRIVKQGLTCKNAFVTTSLCSPSRGSFLTGTYAHIHGVRWNELNDPDPAYPTFPQVLKRNGYATAYIGKWHMANGGQPRPGYDYWLSFNAQGVYLNPEINENGREFKKQGYITDILNEYALNWLMTKKHKPFCLFLSHKAVHEPFEPAVRYKNVYQDVSFTYSPNHQDTLTGKPKWQRANALWRSDKKNWMENSLRTPPSSVNKKKAGSVHLSGSNLKYYQSLNAVDDGLGEIFKLLEKKGELDNTVIIYAGDNGQLLGEHQIGDKRLAYEESIRIPFMMYYPSLIKAGTILEEMVLNIDMAPTILDLANIPIPAYMQGKSIKSLIEGKKSAWRTAFLYEYFTDWLPPTIPTILALRTKDWKYVTHPHINDINELYNLNEDPFEMKNLALLPEYKSKVLEMEQNLELAKKETKFKEREPRSVPLKLLLHYSFDNGDARDASGAGRDGKITGNPVVEKGVKGNSLHLQQQSYISNPALANATLKAMPLAWTAWIKTENKQGVVLSQGNDIHGYSIFLKEGSLHFCIRIQGWGYVVSSQQPLSNDWTHLAGVISSDYFLKLYLNGKLVAQKELPRMLMANPAGPLEIGVGNDGFSGLYGNTNYFEGLIDEVKFYQGSLTEKFLLKEGQR